MKRFARYSAAAVLMILGLWIIGASVLAGNGVHQPGRPVIGIAITAVGLAVCIGAYNIVRHLRGEGIYRHGLNVLLLWGSLTLVGSILRFGLDWWYGMKPSEGEPNYFFLSMFGVACLFTLWLLNARLHPHNPSRR